MTLEDLKRKIYNPDDKLKNRTHEPSQFDPERYLNSSPQEFLEEKNLDEIPGKLSVYEKKAFRIGIFMILGIVILGSVLLGTFQYRKSYFNEEKVSVEISGPREANSNQLVEYSIVLRNENRASLEDAVIELNYPESFQPESSNFLKIDNSSNSRIMIGKISSHASEKFNLAGKFYAYRSAVVFLNASLKYKPSGFGSFLKKESQAGTNINSSAIFLDIKAPFEASVESQVEYEVNFKNESQKSFEGLALRVEYPEGFTPSSVQPLASEGGNRWYLGTLDIDQGGRVLIKGVLKGKKDEVKSVKVFIESAESSGRAVYGSKESLTKIVGSPVSIFQRTSNIKDGELPNVNPGEYINFIISFSNESNISLRNAILMAEVESPVLDFSRIRIGNEGSFESAKKKIIWKTPGVSSLANLAPGQKGEVSFSIPVFKNIEIQNENQKNFTIRSVARLESPDIPTPVIENKVISSNILELKVNSEVKFESLAFYKDSVIKNNGPIPPKVDQETSYSIHWKVSNFYNEISEAKVEAFLPTGAKWGNKFYPETEKINFNPRTNRLVWELGNIKNGTGILNNPKELVFQVVIIPQENEVGSDPKLIESALFSARDSFTGEELIFKSREISSSLIEDQSEISNKGAVIK